MSQIDWSSAPKEATHYDCRKFVSPAFMRKNHNGYDWEFFGDGHWIMYGQLTEDQAAKLVARPQPWTGEGLPPVGAVCEWRGPNSDGPNGWVYAESQVVAYTEDGLFVCMQAPSCWPVVQRIDNCEFRPVRTPKQIAEEARESAIKDLMQVDDVYYEQAANIYDRGYRKFEIVEEQVEPDDRDTEILSMCNTFMRRKEEGIRVMDCCARLYDAGCRMPGKGKKA